MDVDVTKLDPHRKVRPTTVEAMLKRFKLNSRYPFDNAAIQRNVVDFIRDQAKNFMENENEVMTAGCVQLFLNLAQDGFKLNGNVEQFRRDVISAREQFTTLTIRSSRGAAVLFLAVMCRNVFAYGNFGQLSLTELYS